MHRRTFEVYVRIWTLQDAYRLQLKLFLLEVKQQQLLSSARTFLKSYSTISLGKLATYMEVDEPTLRSDTAFKPRNNVDFFLALYFF